MIKAGIIGGSGYTAGELIRLLTFHPKVEIDFIYSSSKPGLPVTQVHSDLVGDLDLRFSGEVNTAVDVLFLCMGHGHSKPFLEEQSFSQATKIIDLSRDFRLRGEANFNSRKFVYGLPEFNRKEAGESSNIANPGCYATAIQLALLPLAEAKAIESEMHIHGITGSTGAGQRPSATTHFSWRNNNVSLYKAFSHQHLDEIKQTLKYLQPDLDQEINFLPMRGNFSRGIFCSVYLDTHLSLDQAYDLFRDYYNHSPFTHLGNKPVDLKQVVGTNKCLLHLQKHGKKLLITSAIDNLLKGASGQALQNLNLMFGLEERTGLQLKSTRF